MTGSVSTCLAPTAASAQEDTSSEEMDEAARVSGPLRANIFVTKWCLVCGTILCQCVFKGHILKDNAGEIGIDAKKLKQKTIVVNLVVSSRCLYRVPKSSS